MATPRLWPGPSWLGAKAALFAVGWGANQFSSLLLAYRAHQHLGLTTVDGLFGVYALGLIPALLIGGPLSDRRGRRIVCPVVVLSGLATGILMAGAVLGEPALYAGRFIAGIASGLAFAPGTAWVKELSVPPFAEADESRAGARRAAIALSAGFGLGPLVSGLLAQWLGAPTVVPYLAHLLVVLAVLPLVQSTPETVPAERAKHALGRAQRYLPRGSRARFFGVLAPMAPWVFAAPAVAFAVLPAEVARNTRGYSVAFAAVTAGLTLLLGVLVQPTARRLDARHHALAAEVGLATVAIGMALAALAARQAQPLLVLVAAASLGAGYGICLVAGLLEAQRLAAVDDLGGLTALYYALTYVGFAAPIVLAYAAALGSYPVLLLAMGGLASLTLLFVRFGTHHWPLHDDPDDSQRPIALQHQASEPA